MRIKLAIIFLVITMMSCVNEKNKSSSKAAPILVCLGNSLTAGNGAVTPGLDDKSKSYPAFLQRKLKIPVINAGVSGNTASQGLARVNSEVLPHNPDIVIIELGANDIFQAIPIRVTQENLQEIITRLDNGKRKIYLAKFYTEPVARMIYGLLNVTDYDKQTALIKEYDVLFETLAASNNVELIEDIWDGLLNEHMADDMHPNQKGYAIMAENYLKILKPYLDSL